MAANATVAIRCSRPGSRGSSKSWLVLDDHDAGATGGPAPRRGLLLGRTALMRRRPRLLPRQRVRPVVELPGVELAEDVALAVDLDDDAPHRRGLVGDLVPVLVEEQRARRHRFSL